MHKIKVQSVTYKMPYLEANKTKLFSRGGQAIFKHYSRTSVFQSYGTARYWTGEAKNKGKQKMRVWNARFWNATPRNATGLREKTKKEKKWQNSTLHSWKTFSNSEHLRLNSSTNGNIFFTEIITFQWNLVFHRICGKLFFTQLVEVHFPLILWNSFFHRNHDTSVEFSFP